jgi:hypothetical protein
MLGSIFAQDSVQMAVKSTIIKLFNTFYKQDSIQLQFSVKTL